ncbi:MAG: UDP-N-acetylmuramoyl-tripeptide--D-alanyl-D-alanine ligase [Tissierellia bacterium]|nr:UDP-N-acetylmuramoyl-tripeptide--D-alanyl-D-alanine ligase [Tissierellia bacterium]
MITLNVETLKKIVNGRPHGIASTSFQGISTDTRSIKEGNLFIPLKGDNFDGHDYIEEAIDKGAAFALSEKEMGDLPVLLVENSKEALFQIAAYHRNQSDATVIAITGSNGKTTTKDLIASILSPSFTVQKTPENLNNEIGLSKTILDLERDTEYLVLEMGMEDFGEISLLTHIAKPDIAIITNIGDCHLKKLKTKENIAKAKLEILEGLQDDGVFIYNHDDEVLRTAVQNRKIEKNTISFGTDENSTFQIEPVKYDETGSTFNFAGHLFTIPLLGAHQMYNGAVAILIAQMQGMEYSDIAKGLTNIQITGMRHQLFHKKNLYILDDSYKSNPQSLISCLNTVNALKGFDRKIAVIGDMLDLGDQEVSIHESMGRRLDPEQLDDIVTIGQLSFHIHEQLKANFPDERLYHFETKEQALATIEGLIQGKTLVMVKGSRALALDELVHQLLEDWPKD